MKPTVRSIAALAGVSRGTVSRVLNNQPDVSAEVRARVLRIIEETGYRKDTRFQGAEKIHIGVIVAHWQNEYFTNSTLRGIHLAERELNTARIQLDVRRMNSRSDGEYIRVCEELLESGVRGLVLNAPDNIVIAAEIERLSKAGVVVVTGQHARLSCGAGLDEIRKNRRGSDGAQLVAQRPHPADYRKHGISVASRAHRRIFGASENAGLSVRQL